MRWGCLLVLSLFSTGLKSAVKSFDFGPLVPAFSSMTISVQDGLDDCGCTLLTRVIEFGDFYLAAELLAFGEKMFLTQKCIDGRELFDAECCYCSGSRGQNLAWLTQLVERSGATGFINENGETLLMLAAGAGAGDVVEIFVAAGANVCGCDNVGFMASDYANRTGWHGISVFLEECQYRREFLVKACDRYSFEHRYLCSDCKG